MAATTDAAEMKRQNSSINISVNDARGKHQADPNAFQLSYGSQEDFSSGLSALVAPPTSQADKLLVEMRREHERDLSFQCWTNPVAKLPEGKYTVSPLEEFEYCAGGALHGGPLYYKEALRSTFDGAEDLERDKGHDGWTLERFLVSYVQSLHELNSEAHEQNINTGTGPGDLGQLWNAIDSAVLELLSKWVDISLFESSYAALKKAVGQYNCCITNLNKSLQDARKAFQLQLLVVPEMKALEALRLRLYSGTFESVVYLYKKCGHVLHFLQWLGIGPMFNRYNNGVCRQRKHGVYSTTIWVMNSGLLKLACVTRAATVWRGVAGRLPGR
jgi:hypothetical protein